MTTTSIDDDVIADLGSIRLRRRLPGDSLDEFRWRRDPELARLNAAAPYAGSFSSFTDQQDRQALYEGDALASFALETKERRHIGTVLYFNVDHGSGSAEYGITIGVPSMLGSGIGTSVTIAVLRHVWASTPLRRMLLHVLEWNARAIRCFQKVGFEECGRVVHGEAGTLLQMDVRREWWLFWDSEGRFAPFERVTTLSSESQ